MRHGSLFSGIGGFDLAAELMGWENVFHCEKDLFCQKILKHYWPYAVSYEDIKNVDFSDWRNSIDILSGGFPCQPFSTAGKRLGTNDERHLWPFMLAAIKQIRPRWVVGENVRGLVSWNDGMVFDQVQTDLENAGYEVLPVVLPAAGVNAPHRRERIWFIAHAHSNGYQRKTSFGEYTKTKGESKSDKEKREWFRDDLKRNDAAQSTANAESYQRPEGRMHTRKPEAAELLIGLCDTRGVRNTWEKFPTQPPVCGGNDGLPSELDGITFSKWRRQSLKGYGNAVVPQVAQQIFRTIEHYELL